MAEYLIKDTTLTAIADVIRAKTGTSDTIAVTDMATKIEAIESGGGSIELDEMLKCFTYQIDEENKTIILWRFLQDQWYAYSGTYDITIPNTISGYNVVISCE